MRRIPLVEWRAQAAAQLMDESLSQQGHGHLSQANMQVEGTGAFPTQVLVEAEELFDVPAVRKIASQGRHLGTSAGASEAFEVVVLGLLSGALNVAIARRGRGSAAGVESFASNGKAGPLGGELLRRQRAIMFLEGGGLAQWCQQVKRSLRSDLIKELQDEVFEFSI